MSERTQDPDNPIQPPRPVVGGDTPPPSLPAAIWAKLQAESRELKAQNFQSREEVLAWLEARGYEDGERILQRLQTGREI